MKHLLVFLLVTQFTFLVAVAQITFTREWVTGKRATGPGRFIIKETRGSNRLLPAIEYLMKNDNVKKAGGFGTPEKRYALPWRISEGVPKTMNGDPLKEDESIQYDIEIPNQKYKPSII